MKQALKNTWMILDRKERQRFVALIAWSIVISIADILALISLLWIINFYIQSGNTAVPSFLPPILADKDSIALIAVFFIFFSLKNIAGYFIAKAHYDFTGGVAVRLSTSKMRAYQQSSYADFVHTDSSAFIRQIALQPFEFSQHVLSGIQQIITQLFLIAIAIIAIVIFNVKLFFLLLIILLPPVVVVFYFIKKKQVTTKKHLRNSNERSYQYLLDALKGYVEANVYQRNEFFLQRFLAYRRQFSTHLFHSLSLQNLPGRVIEIFAVLGLFILILLAKSLGNESSMLITIGAFMAAAYKIIPGIVKVINLSGQVRAYEFSADELADETNQITGTVESNVSLPVQSLELIEVSFKYAQKTIVNNLSFSARRGDIVGISGVSGRGKTTILNLMLGFLEPARGNILINDSIVDSPALQKYWPSMAYVRQQSFFIYDTILRNITLDEKEPNKEKLDFALKVSGLDHLIKTLPEGFNKIITENGKNISGGQQQRIAIARALYKDADCILLDEPFNELDEASVISIMKQLRDRKDKIIILVTHDKTSLSYCNKIIALDE